MAHPGGHSQPAPSRADSETSRFQVGCRNHRAAAKQVIPRGKRAGLPIPCAREAKDSWDACGVPRWTWLLLALFCKRSQTVMMPFHMVIRLTGWMDICALS